jgi:hypothetical protein
MKLLIIFLFFCSLIYGQKTIYSTTREAGTFSEYQTKSGNTLKIGDTLKISLPRLQNFTFITQGNRPAGPIIANTKVVISKIKSIGTKKIGYKTFVLFGGYGLSVYIDYESALEFGEIKNPFISSTQMN